MEGALKRWLVGAGKLVLTVAVTWFIVDRVGLEWAALGDVGTDAWLPDPLLGFSACLVLGAAYLISGSLWGLLVRDLGGPRLPTGEAVRIFMIANLGRYVPGKIWQIAGLAALARGRGVPTATATAAAVLGHGIGLVAASALGMGALLGGPEPYRIWGIVTACVVVLVVLLLGAPPIFRRFAALWFRVSRTEDPEGLGLVHGLRWLVLYALNWAVYGISFWILVRSLGLSGGVMPVASAFIAAYVLGYLMIFAPAGLGPREGFLILFLTPYLGATASGVVAVVARLWTTLVEVLPAGIFWFGYVAGRPTAEGGEG